MQDPEELDVSADITFDFDLAEIAAEAIKPRIAEIKSAERAEIAAMIRNSFMPICPCPCGDTMTDQRTLVQRIIEKIERLG